MKKLQKTAVLVLLALAYVAPAAYASEATGTLTTGVETGINGVVVSVPTGSPAPDTYTGSVSVTLSADGADSIHYTTDGSTPTCSTGSVYSSTISITTTTTINAVSCYPGNIISPVATLAYTISSGSSGGGGGGGSGGGGGGGGGPTCSADADFNNDGAVDIIDLNILTTHWGSSTATDSTGDANCDGTVDIFDLNILTTTWTG